MKDIYADWKRWTVLIIEVSFLLVLGIRNVLTYGSRLHRVCALHHCRTGGTSTAGLIEQLPEVCHIGGKMQVICNMLLKINTLSMLLSNTKS